MILKPMEWRSRSLLTTTGIARAKLGLPRAERKPNIDPGVCAYARAGFGVDPGCLTSSP